MRRFENWIPGELIDNEKFALDKNIIADVIIDTFDIDRDKVFIEDVAKTGEHTGYTFKYVYIWFVKDGEKYPVCNFTEYETRIAVYMDKYLNRRNLFSVKLNRESAKAIAKYIREKTGTNKSIYIFREKTPVLSKLLYLLLKPNSSKSEFKYSDEDDDDELDEDEDYFDD